jgi:hypothetical protein
MARQNINIGSGDLAGDGESLRSAFQKVNANFTELYISSTSTASSITNSDISNWNTAYSWGNHSIRGYLTGTISQHILPSANATYDLGSTSSQWRSLYVSTNTIFIGGTSLSIVDGNLTIDGVSLQSQITGNVEFRNDSLNSINGITISNADQLTAATAQITVPANGSGSVSITNSGTSWAFGNDGSLTFPDGSIQTTAASATTSTLFNGTFTFSLNSIGDLTLPTGWRISSNQINTGLGTTVTSISLITESLSTDRRLEIYSESNRLHLDSHNPTTELYIGDNSQFIALQQSGEIFVSATGGLTLHGGGANSIARIVIPDQEDAPFTPVFIINTGNPGVIIRSGATPYSWQFRGSDGALIFPDNTVQTTAWTGSAPTGTITFSTDTLRNTTSLGGRVQIQTASQQGDPAKTWSFDHGGAGSLILTEGSSIRAKHGFNILATEPEFVNFTSINNFDSLSFLDLTNIVIINPTDSILAAIDPSTSTCVALTGTTVRLMLNNGIVKNYQLTSTFVGEENNPYYGLPVWTGTIPNSGIASTSIKEVSIEYSANWRFDTDGNLTFPDGTIQTTAARATTSTLVNGTYTVALSTTGSLTLPYGTIRPATNTLSITAASYDIVGGGYGYDLELKGGPGLGSGFNGVGGDVNIIGGSGDDAGNVNVTSGANTWTFANDGTLTVPSDVITHGGLLTIGEDDGEHTIISQNAGDLYLDTQATNTDITFRAKRDVVIQSSTDVGNYLWTFDNTGVITVPGNINGNGTSITIQGAPNGNSFLQLNETGESFVGANTNFNIATGGDEHTWTFGADGGVTFPAGGVLKSASDDSLTIRTSYIGLTSPPSLQNSDFVFNGNGVLTLPGSGVIESLLDENLTIRTSYTAMTSPPGPVNNNFVFGGNGSLTIPKGITSLENLELLADNYVIIDSQGNGQIEIGRSSGVGDVILGNRSNQTDVVTEGRFIINSGSQEKFTTKATSTGTVSYDCSGGHVFFHNEYQGANWTANLTNLALEPGKATTITIIINQPSTGYYPNALQIGGVGQTINWQGNATPTPSSLRFDVVTFSIVNNSVSYIVLGQLTGF